MTAGSEYKAVLALLETVELPPDAGRWGGASHEQLSRLAEQFGRTLPEDLVAWLRVCNGVHAGPGGIYGADLGDGEFLDIGEVLIRFPEWRDSGWLPIAGDGTGNHYVVDTTREHLEAGGVYFVEATEESHELRYIVASRLVTFLEFLLLEDLGEDRWPFDEQFMRLKDPQIFLVDPRRLLPGKD